MTAVLAIDIGGTRIRAALVAEDGQILRRAEAPTPRAPGDAVVAEMARVASEAGQGARPAAAGVCAPGPLDSTRGWALTNATIPGFADYPLRDRLQAALGLPVVLVNDGHAASYGEWVAGAGRGTQSMVYVTLSTGIGGGAVVEGRLQAGRMGMAGHVGHMTLIPDGPPCNCGNHGCWEALAAGPAFAARARAKGYADGSAAFAAARAGETEALGLVADEGRWLGLGLVNVLHVYAPERVVLGGGLTAGLDLLRPAIEAEIAARAMAPFRDTPILRAELGDNAGLVGVAELARRGAQTNSFKNS